MYFVHIYLCTYIRYFIWVSVGVVTKYGNKVCNECDTYRIVIVTKQQQTNAMPQKEAAEKRSELHHIIWNMLLYKTASHQWIDMKSPHYVLGFHNNVQCTAGSSFGAWVCVRWCSTQNVDLIATTPKLVLQYLCYIQKLNAPNGDTSSN